MLIVAWGAALVGGLVVAEAAWAEAIRPSSSPPSGPSAWLILVLGEAVTAAAPRVLAFWVVILGGPPLVLTWAALPPADRRTLPVVVIVWGGGSLLSTVGALPMAGVRGALVASVPALLAAEMLRTVFTAAVRRAISSAPNSAR